MTDARAFRGFHFPAEVILWAVRLYLRFPVSYRDLETMPADRGVEVDHATCAATSNLGRRLRQPCPGTPGPRRRRRRGRDRTVHPCGAVPARKSKSQPCGACSTLRRNSAR